MKIRNIEENREKIYVQLKDLKKLIFKKDYVPENIKHLMKTNKRDTEFIEFTNPKDINFFQNQKWIVDYKEIRDLSKEELKEKAQELINKLNILGHAITVLKKENDNKAYYNILKDYNLLKHTIDSFDDVYCLKQGYNSIPFPNVIDHNGITLQAENDSYYSNLEIHSSINPNAFILCKKDRTPYTRKDKIPERIMKQASTIMVFNYLEQTDFNDNFTLQTEISEDQKNIILKLKTIKKEIIPTKKEKKKPVLVKK